MPSLPPLWNTALEWLPETLGWSRQTLILLSLLGGALLLALFVRLLVLPILRRVAARTSTPLDDTIVAHTRRPVTLLAPLLLLYFLVPTLGTELSEEAVRWLDAVLKIALPVACGWLLIAAVRIGEDAVLRRIDLQAMDNLQARKIYTQIKILKRIALFAIGVFTLAVILMSYERLRQLGAGLLASAGLAGLILGFAAQKTLSNLLAGIQIATTQPIRIDDVVIVEGEWGRVEEITLTYVVVRIWDLRRLVVPISYFLEKPFQNWTRTSAAILGTVFLYVDYTVPVEEIRSELHRILDATELWDRQVWNLQVTDANDRTVELRALMSARDSSTAWELRCQVREELVAWLQREHPDALPRFRGEIGEAAAREEAEARTGESG